MHDMADFTPSKNSDSVMRHIRTLYIFLILIFILLLSTPVAHAAPEQSASGEARTDTAASQTSDDESAGPVGADTDPTKPVLFSVRNEYYNLPGDIWRNVVMLRADALALPEEGRLWRSQGLLLRADVPLVSFHNKSGTTTGLGDFYVQALTIPRIAPGFLVAVGTGLVLPTASDDKLGSGQWIAAPTVAPILFFPRRGLAYVKVQDWISFAGDESRPKVHYLTVTPTFLWRIGERWWTVVDAESNTNWERDSQTSYRAGLLIGRMLSNRHGLSLKVELPVGGNRQMDWSLKVVYFLTRF
jgi:hypothetical protein